MGKGLGNWELTGEALAGRSFDLWGSDPQVRPWSHDRAGVERLCRCILRRPFAQERLRMRGGGQIALVTLRWN